MRTIYTALFALCCFVGTQGEGRTAPLSCINAANLVQNCGFETGSFTMWTLFGIDVPLLLDNTYGVEGVDPLDGISPNTGTKQAFFADLVSNATTLSQSVPTMAGAKYVISFNLAQDTPVGAGYSNAFSASFAGTSLVSLTAVPVEGYTTYAFLGTATSANSTVSLTFGNDLGQFLVDDISVAPVPEPSTVVLLALGFGACLLAGRLKMGSSRA